MENDFIPPVNHPLTGGFPSRLPVSGQHPGIYRIITGKVVADSGEMLDCKGNCEYCLDKSHAPNHPKNGC